MTDESLEDRVDALENELNHERTKRDKLEEEFSEFRSEVIRKRAELKTSVNELEETLATVPSASGVDAIRDRLADIEAVVDSFGELAPGEKSTEEARARDLYVRLIRLAANQQGSDDTGRAWCTYDQAVDKLQEAGHDVKYYQQIQRLVDNGHIEPLPGFSTGTDDAGTKVLRVTLAEVPDRTTNAVVNTGVSRETINDVVVGTAAGRGGNHVSGETAHNAD